CGNRGCISRPRPDSRRPTSQRRSRTQVPPTLPRCRYRRCQTVASPTAEWSRSSSAMPDARSLARPRCGSGFTSLDDLVALDLAVPRADVLLVQALAAAPVDEMEVQLVGRLAGRVDLHRDRDQTEAERGCIDRACRHIAARADARTTRGVGPAAHGGPAGISWRSGPAARSPSIA